MLSQIRETGEPEPADTNESDILNWGSGVSRCCLFLILDTFNPEVVVSSGPEPQNRLIAVNPGSIVQRSRSIWSTFIGQNKEWEYCSSWSIELVHEEPASSFRILFRYSDRWEYAAKKKHILHLPTLAPYDSDTASDACMMREGMYREVVNSRLSSYHTLSRRSNWRYCVSNEESIS